MKKNTNRFKVINIILVILACCPFMIIICSEWHNLKLEVSQQGLKYFLDYFDPAIKISSGIIVIWGIILTVNSIAKTKEQITMTQEQNKFANFFIHKKGFLDYCPNIGFVKIHSNYITNSDIDLLTNRLYSCFYYDGYKSFEPKINCETNNKIEIFESKITKIISYSVDEIEGRESDLLRDLFNQIPFRLQEILNTIIDNIDEQEKNKWSDISNACLFLKILWGRDCINQIKMYDGDDVFDKFQDSDFYNCLLKKYDLKLISRY